MSGPGIEVIGHRGFAARFPENTLPSLEGALAVGAASVEFDVRVAACGTPVLFHDATLERTTDGEGALADRTLEELRELDAGSWFGPSFRGTRIPTLQEALRQTLHHPALPRARRVYVELKEIREGRDLTRILETLRETGAMDRAVVISLDFALLQHLQALAPEVAVGFVAESEEALDEALAAVRGRSRTLLDPHHELLRLHPQRTSEWVEEGIRLATWTVNDEPHARELLALGVRRITTDDPEGLLRGIRHEGRGGAPDAGGTAPTR